MIYHRMLMMINTTGSTSEAGISDHLGVQRAVFQLYSEREQVQ